jgi:predicted MPP superfamily phosphohydrolase
LTSLTWLVGMFLTAVCLLAVDIATGFGFFFAKAAPKIRGLALVAGAALSLIALVQGSRAPVVDDFEIRLNGLPAALDGTVVVAMSDLHLGTLLDGEWLRARAAQVGELKPDLVVLLGDIFEGHGEPNPEWLSLLGAIPAKLGIWAVSGNHEFHGGNGNGILADGSGVKVLRNRWAEVAPGLVLAGVEDGNGGQNPGEGGPSAARALAGRPAGAAILLNHYPTQADIAVQAGAGLMLSGHTHGGQVWPFGYLTGLRFPLLDGLYDVDGMKVLVCRGTGTWGPRMRLWKPSQILRITLRSPT